ncbi:hypothetical protein F4780DRAFT_777165 [Xylariomycetidae sp. FL0641]|nr:hypothetical protein F4780DRAFT_777165 [Xylariomycetidae sp. FL0641]
MPPKRKAAEDVESVDSGSDIELSPAPSNPLEDTIGRIERVRTQRIQARKQLRHEHDERLDQLKERIAAHFASEREKITQTTTHHRHALTRALQSRADAESAIAHLTDTLRRDWAHAAMLVGVVYEGRGREVAEARAEEAAELNRIKEKGEVAKARADGTPLPAKKAADGVEDGVAGATAAADSNKKLLTTPQTVSPPARSGLMERLRSG